VKESPLCSVCCSYNPIITSSFTTYHRYVPFVVVIIQSSRGSDDWIITTTNGTHVTPVIDRERGSDDWIITTTNGTHVIPVIGRERGSDDWIILRQTEHMLLRSLVCSACRSYNPIITSSFTTYHRSNMCSVCRSYNPVITF
jgi:hypothetical protein